MSPGIYYGVPMPEYLAMRAVSASLLSAIVDECPYSAWFQSFLNPATRSEDAAEGEAPEADDSEASDAGTIAHQILLEGSNDCAMVIDPADHLGERGAVPKGWTNKSIRAARDYAREQGKIPVLPAKMAKVTAMVESAHAFIKSLKKSEPAVWQMFQFGDGESEATLVWDDNGTLCRARPDRISNDRRLIVDVKTTLSSAHPDFFGRTLLRAGYHGSAAFYCRGVTNLFDVECAYLFLVVEQKPPYLCSLIGLDPVWMSAGRHRVERGLRTWAACAKAGLWPGYERRACYPELPGWADARFEETSEEARTHAMRERMSGIAYGSQA